MHLFLIFLLGLFLTNSCAGPPPHNHVRLCQHNPPQIIIQSSNKTYVRLSQQAPFYLIADAPSPIEADTFCLCHLGSDVVALRGKQQYVTIHLQKANQAIARQKHIDSWEKLIVEQQQQQVAFRATNQLYLQSSPEAPILTASSHQITPNCLFNIIEL